MVRRAETRLGALSMRPRHDQSGERRQNARPPMPSAINISPIADLCRTSAYQYFTI
ncbi:hypothetical protein REMIM1_CH03056 [Rhizobium etli bv. mimosae str. Mim1]|nr:hypothetical protein REMIM1_CH03056 [Rhizobium etli bv. mimosae str. Mim1]